MRVYLSIPQRIGVTQKKVLLGDIAQVITKDEKLTSQIMKVQILDLQEQKIKVLDIVEIIAKLQKKFGDAEIINLGESEFIIQLKENKKVNRLFETAKVAAVSLIVFFGSAFSIMTFNEDSSIEDIFGKVYKLFTGAKEPNGHLIEIAYSVGLTLGILMFYNHIFQKPKMEDPTPMQIEMREFEKDVNETIILNSDREEN